MRAIVAWALLGAGAAFLLAAIISVALDGPGWPYYLGLGGLCVVVGFALGLGLAADPEGAALAEDLAFLSWLSTQPEIKEAREAKEDDTEGADDAAP